MILKALQTTYEAEIASARANIQVYLDNPAGIGEHPDIVSAVNIEICKLSEADDKLHTLNKYYLSLNTKRIKAKPKK